MLHILNWQTLEHRRIQNSLIMLYKIKHQLVNVDHNHLTETRNLKFFVPYSRTKYHMNSYFPTTIRYWNSLPYSIRASTSLCCFSTGLATILHFKIIIMFLNSSKCMSFKIIIIFIHTCLNITHFSSFLAVSRQRLPVIVSESGSTRPRVKSARVSSAGSTRPGQLGLHISIYRKEHVGGVNFCM